MGISILSGRRETDYGSLSRRRLSVSLLQRSASTVQPPTPPNPNPLRFKLERVKQTGNLLAALVVYPDCTNFEGKKIIVFDGVSESELRRMSYLDPHFYEDGPILARLRPDEKGWEDALILMRTLSR